MASYRDAADSIQAAIDFGELAAQRAPAGHPIFDAITRARAEYNYINQSIPWYSSTGPEALPSMVTAGQRAIDDIYDAAASIRSDPDSELARTTYQQPTSLPWPWIAAGVGVVTIAVIYFHMKRAR